MRKICKNRKAQFFIASAIIIIIIVYFIYFNVLKPNDPDQAAVESSDFTYLLSNIQDEYGELVEITLSNVSRTPGANANNALDANLSHFTSFVENLTGARHIVSVITAQREYANSSFMNASVNITLKGIDSQVSSIFYAVRELNTTITAVVTCTLEPPGGAPPSDDLEFRVAVMKEYSEPVTGLVQGDFGGIDLNGVDYAQTTITGFTEEGSGVYLFETSTPCAADQTLKINLTDSRIIYSEGSRKT